MIRYDMEALSAAAEAAQKALKDMSHDLDLRDPRKTEHIKMLMSIIEKEACVEHKAQEMGYSEARDRMGRYSSAGYGYSNAGYSNGGYPDDRRAEQFRAEMGRW